MTTLIRPDSLTALPCPPQWGTPRRWDRPTFGPYAAQAAKKLGWPELMPHQQYKLDVALEHDGNGRMFYQTVVNEEPRQGGKTTGVLAVILMRVQMWTGQNVIYTAQDLNHARKKWRKEHCKRIAKVRGFREGRDYKIRNVNGDESIEFPKTEGWYGISATGEASGHGDTLHLHMCDEAFALRDPRADQSFLPAMATVDNPQQWITSAAGDWRSVYFNDKVARAKAAIDAGADSGICGFIWSAADSIDDVDIYDRDVWRATIPSLGFTQTEERIAGFAASMAPEEFARAFLCITKKPEAGVESALDLEKWTKQVHRQKELVGRLVVGVATPPSRSHTAISIGSHTVEGDLYGEHIETRSGTDWVEDYLAELNERWPQIAGVAIDSGSPAASLIGGLEAAGVTVFKMNASKHADAAGLVHDWLDAGRLWHVDQDTLNDAVAGATKRPLGDRWAFDRRNADVDISPLESMTLALGALVALPEEEVDDGSVYDDRGFVDW